MDAEVAEVFATCAGFTGALRREGVAAAGAGDFATALATLDPMRRDDIYWAGRSTLCSTPDDLIVFDRLFDLWFVDPGDEPEEEDLLSIIPPQQTPSDEGDAVGEQEDDIVYAASRKEVLRHRDLEVVSPAEQQELAKLFDSLVVDLPRRRTRRSERWHRGEIDVRATAREQLRNCGELGALRHRRPSRATRKIVFLIDVSRSMTSYADHLLRLAHRVHRVAPKQVEVFTMGTRLTRVTRALDPADPERALQWAGEVIPDWSGGTRIADGIADFIDEWGRRGMARQAVVVIASDGWERGDTAPLTAQAQRLERLAHRVIWVNPHSGKEGYEPVQAGIAAVLPYIDDMVAGHTLASFSRLLEVIADV